MNCGYLVTPSHHPCTLPFGHEGKHCYDSGDDGASDDESRLPGPPYCTQNGKRECRLRHDHAGGCRPVYCAMRIQDNLGATEFFCDRPLGHNGMCDSDAAVDARTARKVAQGMAEMAVARDPAAEGAHTAAYERMGGHPRTPQPPASAPLDIACGFLDSVKTTLREKNKNYGNSALQPLRCFSRADAVEQIKVRIDDKLSRISRGAGIDAMDEDVIRDLVGYLALFYEARQIGKEKP